MGIKKLWGMAQTQWQDRRVKSSVKKIKALIEDGNQRAVGTEQAELISRMRSDSLTDADSWKSVVLLARQKFGSEYAYEMGRFAFFKTPLHSPLNRAVKSMRNDCAEAMMADALSHNDKDFFGRGYKNFLDGQDWHDQKISSTLMAHISRSSDKFGDNFAYGLAYYTQRQRTSCVGLSPYPAYYTQRQRTSCVGLSPYPESLVCADAQSAMYDYAYAMTKEGQDRHNPVSFAEGFRLLLANSDPRDPDDSKTVIDFIKESSKKFGDKLAYDLAAEVYKKTPRNSRLEAEAQTEMYGYLCCLLDESLEKKNLARFKERYVPFMNSSDPRDQGDRDKWGEILDKATKAFPPEEVESCLFDTLLCLKTRPRSSVMRKSVVQRLAALESKPEEPVYPRWGQAARSAPGVA